MRTIIAVLLGLILMTGIGYAQEEKGILDQLPGLKQGLAWDFQSDEVMSLTSVDVAVYKQKLALGIGALANLDVVIPTLTLNYKIGNFENLGFEYPLQQFVNIEVGIFGGRDFENKEYSYGVQGSIIKIKL